MAFIEVAMNFMIITGLLNVPEDSSALKKKLHKFYSIFSLTYVWIYWLLQFIKIVQILTHEFNIEIVINITYLSIVNLNVNMKITSIISQRKQISQIRDIFLSNLLRSSRESDLVKEKDLEDVIRFGY